jgi:hypothetical protein
MGVIIRVARFVLFRGGRISRTKIRFFPSGHRLK